MLFGYKGESEASNVIIFKMNNENFPLITRVKNEIIVVNYRVGCNNAFDYINRYICMLSNYACIRNQLFLA